MKLKINIILIKLKLILNLKIDITKTLVFNILKNVPFKLGFIYRE